MGKIRKFYQLHKTLQHFSETEEKKNAYKSAIRSKEFTKYLNNLGHCISYDTALRIDTS